MELEFVNHASVILRHKNVNLIMDPWFEGIVFDNGWSLISESKFQIEDFNRITHIWFSHEHPDHFFPPLLNKIPKEFKEKITILFHKTNDKKVVNYCIKKGFKEVVELNPDEQYVIQDDLKIISNEFADGDSWAYFSTDDLGILNVNDCIITNKSEAEIIKSKIGKVDVLLTQFSYANKIGNIHDDELRIKAILEKKQRIHAQSEVFNPQYIIPFASFVFFCHEENKYMNLPRFYLRDIVSFIDKELHKKSIVLFPGDLWDLDENWDSEIRVKNYESDFEKVKNFNFVKTKQVDLKELKEQSVIYSKRLLSKNPTLKSLFKKLHFRFFISDLNIACLFDGRKGMIESDFSKENADIILSSEALSYIFKFEWGAGTCNVNARYQTTEKGDAYRFNLLLKVGNLNNEGKVFEYRKPCLADRILKKLKTFTKN
jgi:UDP-MurNAc hydroxylase